MLAWYGERLPSVESITLLSDAKVSVLENWAKSTPRVSVLDQSSRRITHQARLKAEDAADSVGFSTRTCWHLAQARPGAFQLPPFMKKDLRG